MKIKIYMVTYKGHKRLLPTLTSLFNSDIKEHEFEVNIINNHTDIRMPSEFFRRPQLTVINNSLRPDWAAGPLSRNWNEALINGFKDLNNPDCDFLVCSQDDSIFHPLWASRLIELHNRFTFVHGGHGDQFHSYLPEAVKRVGIWDERFCGLTRQVADYFYRCCMYNKESSTINDPGHRRLLNPIFPNDIVASTNYLVDADVRKIDENTGFTDLDSHISLGLLHHKYGKDPFPWTEETMKNLPVRTLCPNYIQYSYFEKDIYDLQKKGYIV